VMDGDDKHAKHERRKKLAARAWCVGKWMYAVGSLLMLCLLVAVLKITTGNATLFRSKWASTYDAYQAQHHVIRQCASHPSAPKLTACPYTPQTYCVPSRGHTQRGRRDLRIEILSEILSVQPFPSLGSRGGGAHSQGGGGHGGERGQARGLPRQRPQTDAPGEHVIGLWAARHGDSQRKESSKFGISACVTQVHQRDTDFAAANRKMDELTDQMHMLRNNLQVCMCCNA
jgi:hypothetical protein